MRYLILMTALVTGACNAPSEKSPSVDADVVIVGAGISGVSAALEAARGGASVLVVDTWSIFGGHAVMSHGGLCIVDTPVQKAQGVSDSAELAEKDFLTWGEDADAEWVRYYTENSWAPGRCRRTSSRTWRWQRPGFARYPLRSFREAFG